MPYATIFTNYHHTDHFFKNFPYWIFALYHNESDPWWLLRTLCTYKKNPRWLTSERTPPAESEPYIGDEPTRDTQAVANYFPVYDPLLQFCCLTLSLSYETLPTHAFCRTCTRSSSWGTTNLLTLFFVPHFHRYIVLIDYYSSSYIYRLFLCAVLVDEILVGCSVTYPSPSLLQRIVLRHVTHKQNEPSLFFLCILQTGCM